jgi:hypothetical protein
MGLLKNKLDATLRFIAHGPYDTKVQDALRNRGYRYLRRDPQYRPDIENQRYRDRLTRAQVVEEHQWLHGISDGRWDGAVVQIPRTY